MESTSATTTYHRAIVDGVGIFYREAGPKDAPTIVLLHGFPSSSREFDTLIPLLATQYHLVVPDFPGFGQSEAPPPSSYAYTFDHLATTMDSLLAPSETGAVPPPLAINESRCSEIAALSSAFAEMPSSSPLPTLAICSMSKGWMLIGAEGQTC